MSNAGLYEPVISTRVIQFANANTQNMVSATGKASGALIWSGGKLYVSDTAGIMKLVTSA